MKRTLFISLNVLKTWPPVHESRAVTAIASIPVTRFRIDSGDKEPWTSFLILVWYSPWWKNSAEGPIKFSLLFGYVGLNKCAFVISTNRDASGLASMTHGQPSKCVLKISPYLKIQATSITFIFVTASIIFLFNNNKINEDLVVESERYDTTSSTYEELMGYLLYP